jgi:hypothetical protein
MSVFASFQGDLEPVRVTSLFSHRSFADRLLMFSIWLLAVAVMFPIGWLMGAGDKLPRALCWAVSGCMALGMFVFGLVQQFGAWHGRRWIRWNGMLTGAYRITLAESFVDVQASGIAMRWPYSVMAMVDSGLSCVRMGLDPTACRALLLPLADCHPGRSVKEVETFVKERIRESKSRVSQVAEVPEQNLPLPFDLVQGSPRIAIAGPVGQGQLLATLESTGQARLGRAQSCIYGLLGVCFVILLSLLVVGAAEGRQIPLEHWTKLGFLAVFLLVVVIAALRLRWAKSDLRADPDAAAGYLNGWISPIGVVAHYRHGYTSITWSTCDSVEVTEDRILIRFWHGDFILVARHMFPSDSDFEQAAKWAGACN